VKLTDFLRRTEGKTLEFKRDLSSPDGVLRTLVAFANTAGGTLLVGVEDGSRRVCGIPDVLKTEERLANLISDSIHPALVPDIEVVHWRNVNVIAVSVYPSNTRPHHLTGLGIERGTFVRVGSTNRKAGTAQIDELTRLNRLESYDEQAIPTLNSEALDLRVASELLSNHKKITPLVWRTLRVTTEHQGRQVPTIGGLLLFGKDRFAAYPDSWIQVGRFAGINKSRIIDSAEVRSLLPTAVEEAMAFARKHLMVESVIEGVRRQERWSVPLVAIREAVVNAVVHADYAQQGAPIRLAVFDDRIEIENPGLLPFGLTIEDIQRGVSKLRNRVIGRVFHELRLIEHWGSGIQRMSTACEEAGLPTPRMEELGSHFRVTLSTQRVAAVRVDGPDNQILDFLGETGAAGTAAIASAVRLSTRSTQSRLHKLASHGLVVELGTGPHDPKRQYALADNSARTKY
jgi:ATP-dependent DNA helicase RecG